MHYGSLVIFGKLGFKIKHSQHKITKGMAKFEIFADLWLLKRYQRAFE
jgi:hypothetical protein